MPDTNVEISKLTLRSASGEQLGIKTDSTPIERLLKVIGNFKQTQVKLGHRLSSDYLLFVHLKLMCCGTDTYYNVL